MKLMGLESILSQKYLHNKIVTSSQSSSFRTPASFQEQQVQVQIQTCYRVFLRLQTLKAPFLFTFV